MGFTSCLSGTWLRRGEEPVGMALLRNRLKKHLLSFGMAYFSAQEKTSAEGLPPTPCPSFHPPGAR